MTTLNPELQFAVSSTLQERLAELDEQITASESGQEPWVARASEAPDAGDASVADHLQTKERALEQQAVDQRNRVIDALQRLETGDYGECIDCGTEIKVQRLQVQPRWSAVYAVRRRTNTRTPMRVRAPACNGLRPTRRVAMWLDGGDPGAHVLDNQLAVLHRVTHR